MQGESRRARRARRRLPSDPAAAPWFRLPPPPPDDGAPVLVIGAGLGGCALARALSDRGRAVTLIERAERVAAGASGNPVAVIKPFVTRAPSAGEDFFAEAFAALLGRLDDGTLAARAGVRIVGALQLTERSYPPRPPYRVLDAAAADAWAGTRVASAAIAFERGGWLDPAALCRALIGAPGVELASGADIVGIERLVGGDWAVTARDGRRWRAPTLVLASGTALGRTRWTSQLPLTPARGQISRFALSPGARAPDRVVSGHHYAIPDGDTLYVGATFARGVEDAGVRAADHTANLDGLRALLPALRVEPEALSGHAGVRATTPDRLPLVGPVPDDAACRLAYADLARGRAPSSYPPLPVLDGLAVLGGFGSRGAVAAPLCAALLADWLTGRNTLQPWMPLLSPIRFTLRALRRG